MNNASNQFQTFWFILKSNNKPQKDVINNDNIRGVKNFYLNHILKYLVKTDVINVCFLYFQNKAHNKNFPKCKLLVFKTNNLLLTFYPKN